MKFNTTFKTIALSTLVAVMFIATTSTANVYTLYRSSNSVRFKYNVSGNIGTVTSYRINTTNFQTKPSNPTKPVQSGVNTLITSWRRIIIGNSNTSNGYAIPKQNVVQPSTPTNNQKIEQPAPAISEPSQSAPIVKEPTQPAPIVNEPSQPVTTPTIEQEQPEVTQNSKHALTSSELQLIEYVNQARKDAGLKALTIDVDLSYVARVKSEDMYENNYFSHTSPTYGSPFDMMKSFGIKYTRAAENIAKTSSVLSAHNGLMNSEGHRKNILNPNFTHIGVGIKNEYYTQMFITK